MLYCGISMHRLLMLGRPLLVAFLFVLSFSAKADTYSPVIMWAKPTPAAFYQTQNAYCDFYYGSGKYGAGFTSYFNGSYCEVTSSGNHYTTWPFDAGTYQRCPAGGGNGAGGANYNNGIYNCDNAPVCVLPKMRNPITSYCQVPTQCSFDQSLDPNTNTCVSVQCPTGKIFLASPSDPMGGCRSIPVACPSGGQICTTATQYCGSENGSITTTMPCRIVPVCSATQYLNPSLNVCIDLSPSLVCPAGYAPNSTNTKCDITQQSNAKICAASERSILINGIPTCVVAPVAPGTGVIYNADGTTTTDYSASRSSYAPSQNTGTQTTTTASSSDTSTTNATTGVTTTVHGATTSTTNLTLDTTGLARDFTLQTISASNASTAFNTAQTELNTAGVAKDSTLQSVASALTGDFGKSAFSGLSGLGTLDAPSDNNAATIASKKQQLNDLISGIKTQFNGLTPSLSSGGSFSCNPDIYISSLRVYLHFCVSDYIQYLVPMGNALYFVALFAALAIILV